MAAHRLPMERTRNMPKSHGPLRIGVGGPVGSGKTALMDLLCKNMRERYDIAAITNDIYTKWDAEFLVRSGSLTPDRIAGVETGGCPHTAIREDASMNLAAVADMRAKFPNLDLVLIESGGDNLAATFSPELADLTIYVIDVAAGDKIPSKGGPGITALRPAGHQQDRPRPPCRRVAGEDGHRRKTDARRTAVRDDQSEEKRGAGAHHRLYRGQGRPEARRVQPAKINEGEPPRASRINQSVHLRPAATGICGRNLEPNPVLARLPLLWLRQRSIGGSHYCGLLPTPVAS